MTVVNVAAPAGLLTSLRMFPHEVAVEVCLAAAIHWYQQGRISMARAAETAGMNRADSLAELTRRSYKLFWHAVAEQKHPAGLRWFFQATTCPNCGYTREQ